MSPTEPDIAPDAPETIQDAAPDAEDEVLIVGGGLSGLFAARLLNRKGVSFTLWEARERLGGRVLSEPVGQDDEPDLAVDLGPSWIWPGFQPGMAALTRELGVEIFPQHTSGLAVYEDLDGTVSRFPSRAAEPRSYRVTGGIGRLIERLAVDLPEGVLHPSTSLRKLVRRDDGDVEAHGERRDGAPVTVRARHVLLALPPRVAARRLDFEPALDEAVLSRWSAAPTWMAGHAKLQAVYDEPVWRNRGLSGQGFSRRGPLAEIHDASGTDGAPFSLFGFFALSAMERKAAGRTLVEESIFQLERLFGPGLLEPRKILFKDWSDDPLTATELDFEPLAGHPNYGFPASANPLWDGRLHLASTEVSVRNGGYLEGALEGAAMAVDRVLKTR